MGNGKKRADVKRLININYFRNMETRRVTLWEEGLLGLGNGLSQRAPKDV